MHLFALFHHFEFNILWNLLSLARKKKIICTHSCHCVHQLIFTFNSPSPGCFGLLNWSWSPSILHEFIISCCSKNHLGVAHLCHVRENMSNQVLFTRHLWWWFGHCIWALCLTSQKLSSCWSWFLSMCWPCVDFIVTESIMHIMPKSFFTACVIFQLQPNSFCCTLFPGINSKKVLGGSDTRGNVNNPPPNVLILHLPFDRNPFGEQCNEQNSHQHHIYEMFTNARLFHHWKTGQSRIQVPKTAIFLTNGKVWLGISHRFAFVIWAHRNVVWKMLSQGHARNMFLSLMFCACNQCVLLGLLNVVDGNTKEKKLHTVLLSMSVWLLVLVRWAFFMKICISSTNNPPQVSQGSFRLQAPKHSLLDQN